MLLGVMTLFKIVYCFFFMAYLLAIPLVILYSMQTCPDPNTFDAKKHLKRFLRGEYLPSNHPEKPKSWFAEPFTRLQATVTAEVATGLGYTVSFLVSFFF